LPHFALPSFPTRRSSDLGEHVELLLHLALDVDRAEFAEDIGEPGAPYLTGDDLGGEAQIVEQVRQLARGLRVEPLLLHDEPLNRSEEHTSELQSPDHLVC